MGDQDVTDLMANRRGIGFVFQSYALFPHLSVFDNVAYGLRTRKQPEAEVARAVADVLGMVGLQRYERQLPNQLSGGEQQRVALARAIVIRPRVLLFDEPLSNLDATLRVHMRLEIRQLQKDLSITAIYVTHDQEEAMAVSDRIAVMNHGSVVQEGTAEDLYHRPASEFVARFIGRVNLLAGRVLAVGDGGAAVEVAGRRLRLAVVPDGIAAGETVRLVVRPEAITLVPDAPGRAADGFPGTVVARTFLGEKVDYHVRLGEDLLQVTRGNTGAGALFGPGAAVRVELPTRDVTLLRGSPA
jgi:iron(III) transport system ATP-binding protein